MIEARDGLRGPGPYLGPSESYLSSTFPFPVPDLPIAHCRRRADIGTFSDAVNLLPHQTVVLVPPFRALGGGEWPHTLSSRGVPSVAARTTLSMSRSSVPLLTGLVRGYPEQQSLHMTGHTQV